MPKTYNFSKANEHFNPSAIADEIAKISHFSRSFFGRFWGPFNRSTGGIAKKKRWDDNDDDDHVKMRG